MLKKRIITSICHVHGADELISYLFLLDTVTGTTTMHYGQQEKHSWLKQPSHKFLLHYIRTFVGIVSFLSLLL